MAYSGGNPNGQATSVNSAPVVIASDNVVDTASNQVIVTGSITAADAASTTGSGQASQVIITGTPTANSAYGYAIPNVNGAPESFSSVVIHITGTFVGTYQFERSPDAGTTWTPFTPFVAGQPQTTATGTLPGMFHGNISGVTNVRVRCTAFTSGTINVRFSYGIGTGTITVGNPIRLYDVSNNTQATIKPSSTAPVATDTSIVTTEHPNSPLLTSTLNVKTASDASVNTTFGSSTTLTTAALNGVSTATIQVFASANWTGTLTPQASVDGTNYVAMGGTPLLNVNTGAYAATITSSGATTVGIWQVDVAGFLNFRLSMAWTSGAPVVTIRTSNASGLMALDAALPVGSNTIGNVNIAGGQGIGLNPQASSSALTIYSNQALAATVVYVKTTAARMHEYDFYNPNTSGVWIQFFNAASGVTLGTTSPTRTLYVPASAGRDLTSPFSGNWSNGLAIACTTTNTGSTAPSSTIQVYIGYV